MDIVRNPNDKFMEENFVTFIDRTLPGGWSQKGTLWIWYCVDGNQLKIICLKEIVYYGTITNTWSDIMISQCVEAQ